MQRETTVLETGKWGGAGGITLSVEGVVCCVGARRKFQSRPLPLALQAEDLEQDGSLQHRPDAPSTSSSSSSSSGSENEEEKPVIQIGAGPPRTREWDGSGSTLHASRRGYGAQEEEARSPRRRSVSPTRNASPHRSRSPPRQSYSERSRPPPVLPRRSRSPDVISGRDSFGRRCRDPPTAAAPEEHRRDTTSNQTAAKTEKKQLTPAERLRLRLNKQLNQTVTEDRANATARAERLVHALAPAALRQFRLSPAFPPHFSLMEGQHCRPRSSGDRPNDRDPCNPPPPCTHAPPFWPLPPSAPVWRG
jgi:hypothetical protein